MKIINISDLRKNKAISKNGDYLREFEDYYEYCFLKEYEMKYDEFKCQSIQLTDVFVNLLEIKQKTLLASLIFPKSFRLSEIIDWFETYKISFNERDQAGYFITSANAIIENVKFKGLPIVLATRGQRKIYYRIEDLVEITDEYEYFPRIVNTGNAKPVDFDNNDN